MVITNKWYIQHFIASMLVSQPARQFHSQHVSLIVSMSVSQPACQSCSQHIYVSLTTSRSVLELAYVSLIASISVL